jgi:hypothetical protein
MVARASRVARTGASAPGPELVSPRSPEGAALFARGRIGALLRKTRRYAKIEAGILQDLGDLNLVSIQMQRRTFEGDCPVRLPSARLDLGARLERWIRRGLSLVGEDLVS